MKTTLVQAKWTVSTDGDENHDTQEISNSTVAQGQGKADFWANLSALICVIVAGCKYKDVIIPWLSLKLYQIDFSGLVVLGTGAFAFFTKFLQFKNTCAKFYGRQRLRLTYIDEIPGIKEDVANIPAGLKTIKADVKTIKTDVADIKVILSLPWYKRLNIP